MIAWALIFITCFEGTDQCMTTSTYYESEHACQIANVAYVNKGSCIKSHIQLKINHPTKGPKPV